MEEFFGQVLALSEYPSGFPHEYQVAYRQEPRELVIEYQLPPAEVIPAARDFRYVKTRREIDELPRPPKEIKELYASVIHQVALRSMWECFRRPRAKTSWTRSSSTGSCQRPTARPGSPKNST